MLWMIDAPADAFVSVETGGGGGVPPTSASDASAVLLEFGSGATKAKRQSSTFT